ncbi:MAG: D-tyrosyl-tRNA(Tyr) deacylase [Lachnospiraceae bacterium]|nr:D-tyrosyl-tRNA(Tyr) deacylase [Lachnospiraceae bacterium]
MKFVIQRVSNASVEVAGETVGAIRKGYMVLIGVGQNDTRAEADKLIKKMIGLRIFPDADGKINLSLNDVNGELLLVSQFTLYANCLKGNRPSFIEAGDPTTAEDLYNYIITECRKRIPVVEKGIFGAHMNVSLCNEGPFTIILES